MSSSSAAAAGKAADFCLSLRICFCERASAAAKRAFSASTASSAMRYSGTGRASASTMKAVPTAMPPATASPSNIRSALARRRLAAFLRTVSVLIELALDQLGDRQQRRFGVGARREQLDL